MQVPAVEWKGALGMVKADRVAEILAEIQGSAAEGGGLADRLVRVGAGFDRVCFTRRPPSRGYEAAG